MLVCLSKRSRDLLHALHATELERARRVPYISQTRVASVAGETVGGSHANIYFDIERTEQGVRGVKEAPKRSQAAKEMAKKMGVEVKQVYLTSGEHDLLLIVASASGDNVAKFALATGSLGNVRTSTSRAWSETEFHKLIAEIP
jgi:uncharacterized protein with GYD domain